MGTPAILALPLALKTWPSLLLMFAKLGHKEKTSPHLTSEACLLRAKGSRTMRGAGLDCTQCSHACSDIPGKYHVPDAKCFMEMTFLHPFTQGSRYLTAEGLRLGSDAHSVWVLVGSHPCMQISITPRPQGIRKCLHIKG